MNIKYCLVVTLLLSITNLFAQQVIVEEKFQEDNVPVGHHFLSIKNEMVIEKGKHIAISTNREINQLNAYDSKGDKLILIDNVKGMNSYFSFTENTIRLVDYAKMSYKGSTYKIIKEGKASKEFNVNPHYNYLIDNYQFNIENEKGKTFSSIKFEKEDLYLNRMDLTSFNVKRIKIKKPNVDRLLGEENVKYGNSISFDVLPKKENFELITKSISKDYKSSTLYRTIYNYEGNQLNEMAYTIAIDKDYLTYSANGAGSVDISTSGALTLGNDLSINDFIEDKNNNVYIYGLIGKKDRKSNAPVNNLLGYYIFKFDKSGKQIWKSIHYIEDKKDFNDSWSLPLFYSNLTIENGKLLFLTGPSSRYAKEFFHISHLNIENGDLISTKKYEHENNKIVVFMGANPAQRNFITSFVTDKKILKNKMFDFKGYYYYDENSEFKKYVDSVISKDEIMFETETANESDGFWLLETDNKTYYKVIYFKN